MASEWDEWRIRRGVNFLNCHPTWAIYVSSLLGRSQICIAFSRVTIQHPTSRFINTVDFYGDCNPRPFLDRSSFVYSIFEIKRSEHIIHPTLIIIFTLDMIPPVQILSTYSHPALSTSRHPYSVTITVMKYVFFKDDIYRYRWYLLTIVIFVRYNINSPLSVWLMIETPTRNWAR